MFLYIYFISSNQLNENDKFKGQNYGKKLFPVLIYFLGRKKKISYHIEKFQTWTWPASHERSFFHAHEFGVFGAFVATRDHQTFLSICFFVNP